MFTAASPNGDRSAARGLPEEVAERLSAALNEAASQLAQLAAVARSAEVEVGFHPAVSSQLGPRLQSIGAEATQLVRVLDRTQTALAGEAGAPSPVPEQVGPSPRPTTTYSFAARGQRDHHSGRSPIAVRLLATQLAEKRSCREEIEQRLRAEFGIAAPEELVGDLLAKVAN